LEELRFVDDSELSSAPIGRLTLLMLKHAWKGRLWQQLLAVDALVGEVLRSVGGLRAMRRIFNYILLVYSERETSYPEQEVQQMLSKYIDQDNVKDIMTGADVIRKQSREEGYREGQLNTRREMLTRLLEHRFQDLPPATEARIAQADHDELEGWIEAFFRGDDLETIFST